MNSRLSKLQPYPFEKLRTLLAGLTPAGAPIRLSIGEPQHRTPDLIGSALTGHLDGLSVYPATAGLDWFREAIAGWFTRRYGLTHLDPRTQVLPVNGTREALFAFGQAVIDPSRSTPAVVSPNPFYQIYEGAALLAGAEPLFLNQSESNNFALDLDSLSDRQWERTQLLYVCSPANPSGRVLTLEEWRTLFHYSDRHGFVIASDECYSEIYDERAPLGALEAAQQLGRDTFPNLVVFNSLSKRSNAPGLRSGAVAGDGRCGPHPSDERPEIADVAIPDTIGISVVCTAFDRRFGEDERRSIRRPRWRATSCGHELRHTRTACRADPHRAARATGCEGDARTVRGPGRILRVLVGEERAIATAVDSDYVEAVATLARRAVRHPFAIR